MIFLHEIYKSFIYVNFFLAFFKKTPYAKYRSLI